jgi:transcriptional regulator with XRE-family HTH domain
MTQTAGEMIKAAREAKGLSIRQAADKLGMHFAQLHKIETGERAVSKYARPIAKLLGLNVDELVARSAPSLPALRPYLRAKYELGDEAIAELEQAFKEAVARKTRGKS